MKQCKGRISHLICRDIGNKRWLVLACLENTIDAADWTGDLPGNMRTVTRSGEHTSRVEIAAPINTHSGRSHSSGQEERAGVVRDNHAAPAEKASGATKPGT